MHGVDRLNGLRVLVGNTPLLEIHFTLFGRHRTIWAKAEQLNLTGSIKDRMAFHVLRDGYQRGLVAPGGTIIEATSGNTGIAFAAMGRAIGHPVVIFMPEWMSEERLALMRSFGADVRLVSAAEGGFLGSLDRAEDLARELPGSFLPRQFANEANVASHERTTGPEIWAQMRSRARREPDAFVAGVGTGGTIMGAGRYLRRMNPRIRLYPVEPASSPTLTTGRKLGTHRIQGISDEFVPPIVKLSDLDCPIAVDDGDAIIMAQRLAAELGLGVGISSGANFLAAIEAGTRIGDGASVVTIFPDSNKKYLSTALMREEPARSDYIAPEVRFVGYHAIGRVCDVCFEGDDPALFPVKRAGTLATAEAYPTTFTSRPGT
jgi:cysteine synthase A